MRNISNYKRKGQADKGDLRSRTSLAALTFEAANPLLSPFGSHPRKLGAVEEEIWLAVGST
jgi:hypothetical protein